MKYLLWIALMSLANFGYSQTGTLTVKMTSFKNNTGKAQLAIFNNAEAFPSDLSKIYRTTTVTITNNTATAVFENLPYGNYAVAVFHDENSSRKLETNWMGIPTEGYGFSNDAKGTMGPPKYKDAMVNLNGTVLLINIKIGY